MKTKLVLMVVCFFSTLTHADLMSPERSRCMSMQSVTDSYFKWQADFANFNKNEAQMDEAFKYQAEFAALNSLVAKMQDLKRLSLISNPDATLIEAKALIRASASLAKPFALRSMKAGMTRLSDRMDALIYAAQLKHDCQLEKNTPEVQSFATSHSSRAEN